MAGPGWIEGIILISPHLLMIIAVLVVALSVSSVFLKEDHIVSGVCITFFSTLVVALCIKAFWQGYG